MKEQDKIPTSKVKRAAKIVSAGAKVSGNYMKYYAKRAIGSENAKEELDEENAEDIYQSLSELKGSALKMAQIMSMDKGMMPTAFSKKFSQAQYSAPPLSYPLVVKTFRQQFGKTPSEVFDTFSKHAINAASIGQVHKATLDGHEYAVKVQYPGVADAVKSDLKMVKPIAMRMMGVKEKDVTQFIEEVESKLLEETDYHLELKQSMEIGEACKDLEGLFFPKYYPSLSGDRILTMDWLEGMHLKEFLETKPSQEIMNKAAQGIWDFYDYQLNELQAIHADPHPGNFMFRPDGSVGVIDFGCIKRIPEEFYSKYFQLMDNRLLNGHDEELMVLFEQLEFITEKDTEEQRKMFFEVFKKLMSLLTMPFRAKEFYFGGNEYYDQVHEYGNEISQRKDLKKAGNARGSRHLVYINRTYMGLYAILNELNATIDTTVSFDFEEQAKRFST
ncbi:MAG: putative unusual protein kinase regulating ubiquinone biosynthesis (AarF/ABC1/UbiB family) [Parvicellaceae bacterium]|jgi:predicted unusual protein kinase regulating ubiquinone biosynthesis (AarF/ABC1/UbiB family)